MQLIALVVDVFEAATKYRYPIVRHAFYGRNRAEVDGYFHEHMSTDEFLRDCIQKRNWNGVPCATEVFVETVKHA